MGLIGDTIDAAFDGVDTINDAIFGGGDDGGGDDSNIGDDIDDTEDSINDGIEDGGDTVGDGAETVFEGLNGGADALQGVLNWVAGFGDAIKGTGEFTLKWGGNITGAEQVGAFLKGVGGAVSGFFHGLAGGVETVQGFFGFLGTLQGIELATFLIGMIMLIVGIYLAISGILSGEFLLVTSYTLDVGISMGLTWFGLLLILYTFMNVAGGVAIFGSGVIFLYVYKQADESIFMLPGYAATVLGSVMAVNALLGFGALASLLVGVASPYVLYSAPTLIRSSLSGFSSSVKTNSPQ